MTLQNKKTKCAYCGFVVSVYVETCPKCKHCTKCGKKGYHLANEKHNFVVAAK